MPKRSLYAVLAGINTYPPPVKSLQGALKDLEEWQKYLEGESDLNVHTTILTNEAVTKSNLTKALCDALVKSLPEDVVFFFFAGHGTREKADPLFSYLEQDDALECLVCHDSVKKEPDGMIFNLLADKEIHYILSEHAKEGTHILMVFDCCHAGGITKNALPGEGNGQCYERRLTLRDAPGFIAPQREWGNFLFASKWDKEAISSQGWLRNVVQKPHITLSACQNDESAYEQNGQGIFTANLLNVLKRSKGAVSYYHLQSRVRLFMQNQFRQTPESYIIRGHEHLLFKNFLDKIAEPAGTICTMAFKKFSGWIIDLGALHGITTESGPVNVTIQDAAYELEIEEVFPHYSTLVVDEELKKALDKESAYDAVVRNQYQKQTAFFIDPINDDTQALQLEIGAFLLKEKPAFRLSEERGEASYIIREHDRKFWICHNDDALRPVSVVPLDSTGSSERLTGCMERISRWESIRSLENPDFTCEEMPVAFRFYKISNNGMRQEIFKRGQSLHLTYDQSPSGEWTGKFQACVTNTGKTKYYFSILYLSNLFEVYTNMLDGKVVGLNPGETAWIFNGNAIELTLEPHIVEYNYPSSDFYLKLFASPRAFTVDVFEQAPLPSPSGNQGTDEENTKRGFKLKGKVKEEAPWFTYTVCVRMKNPAVRL